jgi:hypothetical protein
MIVIQLALAGSGIADTPFHDSVSSMNSGSKISFGWTLPLGVRLLIIGLIGLALLFRSNG